MLFREGKLQNYKQIIQQNVRQLHPMWQELYLKNRSSIFFNPYSGQLSIEFPKSQQECFGGILADEMGLGKTVMMLSLIHSNKRWDSEIDNKLLQDDQKLVNEIPKQDDSSDQQGDSIEEEDNDSDVIIDEDSKDVQQSNQIQINRVNAKTSLKDYFAENYRPKSGTLVIVPLTLLSQWAEEIETHSKKNAIKYYKYYQLNDKQKETIKLDIYDVIITTYGCLSSEWNSNKKIKPLYKYDWYRIILDEAHYIKGRIIQTAKACFQLKGYSKWCMTGTPIQNKLDELFSLIHFIHLEPWCDYTWWNKYVLGTQKNEPELMNDIVQTILRPILMRRCKDSKDKDGKLLIEFPKKYISIVWVELSGIEREIYDRVEQKQINKFNEYEKEGVVLTNYMHIFQLINKLRQLCDHPFLLECCSDYKNITKLEKSIKYFIDKRNSQLEYTEKNKHSHFEILVDEQDLKEEQIDINMPERPSDQFFQEVMSDLRKNNYTQCKVCFDELQDSIITSCLHVFCRLCITRTINTRALCPICRRFLTKEDFMTIPRETRFVQSLSQYKRSAKIDAIMMKLQEVFNRNEKVVIFTIFLGMMDLLEHEFKGKDFKYFRFDGKTNQKQREKILHSFKNDENYKILMISLEAGGCGLNLVVANNVFIIDPWWNPAVEDQATERVHRIGQKKEVYVTRFLVKNTVEERMHEKQQEKKNLFDNIMKGKALNDKEQKQQNLELLRHILTKY